MTKPDTVDQKISLLVAELVDLAPLPPPVPDGDAVRRWRERRRRRLAFRSLTVASAAGALPVLQRRRTGPLPATSPLLGRKSRVLAPRRAFP
jgi:hypothetical protein